MSGSTADADIAERRKLEAELRDARENLDDTFYQHSKDSQSKALDDELENFQKIREDYVEGLRDTLEDTVAIIAEKITEVLGNADTVMNTLNTTSEEYGVTLTDNLKAPWVASAQQATDFKNTVCNDVGSLINESGIITLFGSEETKAKITSVFGAGTASSTAFKGAVESDISAIKNVVTNSTSELTSQIAFPWNDTTKEGGPIATFDETAQSAINNAVTTAQNKSVEMKNNLSSPWNDGVTAVNTWSKSVGEVLNQAKSDAATAGAEISKSLNVTTPSYTGTSNNGDGSKNDGGKTNKSDNIKALQKYLNQYWNSFVYQATGVAQLAVDGSYGSKTKATVKAIQNKLGVRGADGLYGQNTAQAMANYLQSERRRMSKYPSSVAHYNQAISAIPPVLYAKGTMGTNKDQWAITDESWIGEEITLAAGKNGQLQYLKKGSAVMPADISANLVEWGKLNPDMMNISNPIAGINMISNCINKPELNLSFDALVKAQNITEETLPAVKKLVTEELDKFTRKLNYALKRA